MMGKPPIGFLDNMPPSKPGSKMERRELLKVLCASTGAACAGLAACGPADPYMAPPSFIQLPAVSQGRVRLALADYPQLKVGTAIIGESTGLADPLVIARQEDSVFLAMPAVCTHMKCSLKFNALNVTLDCGCHGSTFELDGQVVNGPAVKPLPQFKTEFDGAILAVVVI
jgi:Rieske Fe-S protein